MFKLAVLGPIVTGGLGVARQCFECRRWDASYRGIQCYGFGSGCIEYHPRSEAGDYPLRKTPAPPLRG